VTIKPKILVAVGHGFYSPWIDIAVNGQNQTWLAEEVPENISILNYHGTPLGRFGRLIDRLHERVRWSNRFGYAVLRIFDLLATLPFLGIIPRSLDSNLLFLKHKTIHICWPDSYLTFRWKAKGMFRFAVDNYDFDFLFMTTTSSYVRLDELTRILSSQSPIQFFAGASAYPGANFAAGSNRVLSRDLVIDLLNSPLDYPPFPIEDLSLSKSVLKKGVNLVRLPHVDIDSFEKLNQVSDAELLSHYHFRLKSGSLHDRNDVAIMKALHQRLENISYDS
jgi:hypothetical protein